MSDNVIICSYCKDVPEEYLEMDCEHNICLLCAKKETTKNEEYINCLICNSKTIIESETLEHINNYINSLNELKENKFKVPSLQKIDEDEKEYFFNSEVKDFESKENLLGSRNTINTINTKGNNDTEDNINPKNVIEFNKIRLDNKSPPRPKPKINNSPKKKSANKNNKIPSIKESLKRSIDNKKKNKVDFNKKKNNNNKNDKPKSVKPKKTKKKIEKKIKDSFEINSVTDNLNHNKSNILSYNINNKDNDDESYKFDKNNSYTLNNGYNLKNNVEHNISNIGHKFDNSNIIPNVNESKDNSNIKNININYKDNDILNYSKSSIKKIERDIEDIINKNKKEHLSSYSIKKNSEDLNYNNDYLFNNQNIKIEDNASNNYYRKHSEVIDKTQKYNKVYSDSINNKDICNSIAKEVKEFIDKENKIISTHYLLENELRKSYLNANISIKKIVESIKKYAKILEHKCSKEINAIYEENLISLNKYLKESKENIDIANKLYNELNDKTLSTININIQSSMNKLKSNKENIYLIQNNYHESINVIIDKLKVSEKRVCDNFNIKNEEIKDYNMLKNYVNMVKEGTPTNNYYSNNNNLRNLDKSVKSHKSESVNFNDYKKSAYKISYKENNLTDNLSVNITKDNSYINNKKSKIDYINCKKLLNSTYSKSINHNRKYDLINENSLTTLKKDLSNNLFNYKLSSQSNNISCDDSNTSKITKLLTIQKNNFMKDKMKFKI